MADFVIIGTDTNAGKTTFAMLWLAAFGDEFDYWKPLETGDSDSQAIAAMCPGVLVHPPVMHFEEPVAPLLAARREKRTIPSGRDIAAARPGPSARRSLLIETFGSPFSPLNETEDQLVLVRVLGLPTVLVSWSTIGAIGRTRQAFQALAAHGLTPRAVLLLGPVDAFAEEMLSKEGLPVLSLEAPTVYTRPIIQESARRQQPGLQRLRQLLQSPPMQTALTQRDGNTLWHPYTPLQPADAPLVCVGAQDEFLHLADGRRVIDGISSWWTILHGHRFPPLLKALHEAAAAIDHVHFAGVTHPWGIELAELLLGSLPWRGGRVFYSDNGSTAVEVALKMAYQFWCHQGQPHRQRFVGFDHGYHGDTFGAMAVSRDPVFFGRFEPLLFQADVIPLDPNRLDDFLTRNPDVAAVILEPLVQGAGGMRLHGPETLRQIIEATRRHDVLFIADEVMTGGGRTGHSWAFQAADIAPDFICAAKTLTGGILPLAATLVSPRIVEAFDTADRARTFFHGHSFTGHPMACAVALANWRLLPNALAAPGQMELFWRQALEPLRDHPRVADVRILGSMAAVEVKASGGYLAEIGRRMYQNCLANDVLLRPLGNVLYAMPPFCTSPESLARITEAMASAVLV